MKSYKFYITTTTGIEDITKEEIEDLGGRVTEIARGRISLEADLDFIFRANYLMRSGHKVILVLIEEENIKSLDDAYNLVRSFDFSEYIGKDQSFAVKFDRVGEHDFTSVDLSARVGSAIIASYKSSTGHRLKVNLKNPDVEFEGKLINDKFILGINTSGESLHKRRYRVSQHIAPLKPTIAYTLVKISNWTDKTDKVLVDPMCGSGTILIEAALFLKNIPPGYFRSDYSLKRLIFYDEDRFFKLKEKYDEKIKWDATAPLYGIEIDKKFFNGAIENAKSAKVSDTITFILGDGTKMDELLPVEPNIVVVNPPYGRRLGRKCGVEGLYEKFVDKLSKNSSIEKMVIMTANKKMEMLAKKYFKLEEKRVILYGSLATLIYKFLR